LQTTTLAESFQHLNSSLALFVAGVTLAQSHVRFGANHFI